MHGLVIDVEATGPHPLTYSMVQIGAVDLEGAEFTCKMRPRVGTIADPGAMKSINLTWEEVCDWPEPGAQISLFKEFLQDTYGGKRVPSWSDNPAFDWQFINAYLWEYTGGNPLGFSMRRIGDFYAGLQHNVGASTKWKRLRGTKHTHDALDDSRGNAEALRKILELSC